MAGSAGSDYQITLGPLGKDTVGPEHQAIVFRDFGHGAVKHLKAMGLLDRIIGQCFDEVDPTDILTASFDPDSSLLR